MSLRLSLLLLALLVPAAFGASGLESSRAGAREARERVAALRTQQMALRSELNGVAATIQGLKERRQGRVLVNRELDAALRRSQELSGNLSTLAQTLGQAEGEAQRQNLELLSALSQALGEARKRFDKLPL